MTKIDARTTFQFLRCRKTKSADSLTTILSSLISIESTYVKYLSVLQCGALPGNTGEIYFVLTAAISLIN